MSERKALRERLNKLEGDFARKKDAKERDRHLRELVTVRTAALEVTKQQLEQEISERKEAQKTLQTIFDSMPGLIFFADKENRFVRANRALCEALGVPEQELIGKPLPELFPDRSAESWQDALEVIESGVAKLEVEEPLETSQGTIWLRTDKVPYRNASGEIIGVVGISVDITERKLAEEKIEKKRSILENINKIFQRTLSSRTERELAVTCLKIMEEATGSHFSLCGEVNERGLFDTLAYTIADTDAVKMPEGEVWQTSLNEEIAGVWARPLTEGRGLIIENPPLSSVSAVIPTGPIRIISYMGVPLKRDHQIVGLVAVANKEGGYDSDDMEVLEILSIAFREALWRKKAELEVTRHRIDLERSNAELQQFADVVSHDLQEPLRMVTSFAQLLAKRYQGKLDSDADEFIKFMADGANRMQALINDLLLWSRVEPRGKPFELTDFEAALGKALDNLRLAIEESGTTVTSEPLPVLMADDSQLVQLFQNLIGNAIKFRRDEPPTVHISAAPDNDEWVFLVKDNGIGFDTQYSDRIFTIFKRLHSRDELNGTGIGLAVAKKIVERHGGRIWADSEPGKGSTFYFTLPMRGRNGQ